MNNFSEEDLRDAFNQVDTNGSGTIDAGELLVLCQRCGVNCTQIKVDNFLASHDLNHDGNLTFEEFKSCIEFIIGGG